MPWRDLQHAQNGGGSRLRRSAVRGGGVTTAMNSPGPKDPRTRILPRERSTPTPERQGSGHRRGAVMVMRVKDGNGSARSFSPLLSSCIKSADGRENVGMRCSPFIPPTARRWVSPVELAVNRPARGFRRSRYAIRATREGRRSTVCRDPTRQ